MSENIAVLPKRWTTSDLIKLVPQNWRNVEVCVGNSIGKAESIQRISFHTNSNGKRVILLHEEELQNPKA